MKRSKKKPKRKVQVPVASMGDIAFLLIIFFLLLSEPAKDKDLSIDLPLSDQVQKTEYAVVARVAIDDGDVIYFDGIPVDSAKDVEWGLRALLVNTVSDDQRRVQLKIDETQRGGNFVPVFKAIAEAGGIVEAVAEKEHTE